MRRNSLLLAAVVIAWFVVGVVSWIGLSPSDRSFATNLDDLTWEMNVDPAEPQVGDIVDISFKACCGLFGPISAELHIEQGDEPTFEIVSEGSDASWQLEVLAPGSASMHVTGSVHKDCGFGTPASEPTPTATPFVCLDNLSSPTFVLIVQQPSETPAPTVPPAGKACGDVNDDGLVDSRDATLILQQVAGLTQSVANPNAADVNEDMVLSSVDATLVLQLDAGLVDGLSCA